MQSTLNYNDSDKNQVVEKIDSLHDEKTTHFIKIQHIAQAYNAIVFLLKSIDFVVLNIVVVSMLRRNPYYFIFLYETILIRNFCCN